MTRCERLPVNKVDKALTARQFHPQTNIPRTFSGQNGKYLHFHDDGLSADSEDPQAFYLELRDPTRMCIKTAQGRYVNSEKNGGLGVGSSDAEGATQWEY